MQRPKAKSVNPLQAIKQARALSNAAFKDHNMAQITALMVDEIVVTVGSGDTVRGIDDVYAALWSQFQASPDCLYVRTPKSIKVASSGLMAFEEGVWTGSWTQDSIKTECGGRYAAGWRFMYNRWLIHSELFVTLMDKNA